MADYCLICETEPIDNSDWFVNEKSTEMICPWCVKEARARFVAKGNKS